MLPSGPNTSKHRYVCACGQRFRAVQELPLGKWPMSAKQTYDVSLLPCALLSLLFVSTALRPSDSHGSLPNQSKDTGHFLASLFCRCSGGCPSFRGQESLCVTCKHQHVPEQRLCLFCIHVFAVYLRDGWPVGAKCFGDFLCLFFHLLHLKLRSSTPCHVGHLVLHVSQKDFHVTLCPGC